MEIEDNFSYFEEIDREWEALNKDFDEDAVVDVREIELQEQYDAIEKEVYDQFSLLDTPRVLDSDIEFQKSSYSEYLTSHHAELYETYERQRASRLHESVTNEEDADIWVECLFQYYELRSLEASMLQDIAHLRQSIALQENSDESVAYRKITKKFTQAHMYQYGGWDPDHPFQQFFNMMTMDIPGLSFYVDQNSTIVCRDATDELFLEIAKVRHKKYLSGQNTKRRVVKEAMQLIGDTGSFSEHGDLGRLLDIAGDLIAMLDIATVATPTDIDQLHKRNALWEAGRMMELGDDRILASIVELYMQHYGFGSEN